MNDKIRKNILDLEYSKYLQYYNTSIVVLFTYLIALIVALFTNQIKYENYLQLSLFIPLSVLVIGIVYILLSNFKMHLRRIPKEIVKLNL